MEDVNNYTELPTQLQQQQTSTDQINNDGYSTVNEWLPSDYVMPTDNIATSPQAHTYTSLMNPEATNPEATNHGYADLIRSKEPISESTGNSEQRPHEYNSVIRQDENKAAPHEANHYTDLTNPQPVTSHIYTDLTRSKAPTNESTRNSHQCLQEYCTVVRQDGKKVTVKFTVSDPPEQYQNENPVLADNKV